MKKLLILLITFLVFSCKPKKMTPRKLNKNEIFKLIDLAANGVPNQYFPTLKESDTKHNFFLDLEHGYFDTAGSKIHLFADETRWAIVFQKNGYSNRGYRAEIQLDYIGNCINYNIQTHNNINSISNSKTITLIDSEEFSRVENKDGIEVENFELISANTKEVVVKDKKVSFNKNLQDYKENGISIRTGDNSQNLIGFPDFIRYLNATSPKLINASEDEIRSLIPNDIPFLLTIDEFHFESIYKKEIMPSKEETFQLITDILISKDISKWKPTQKPNNHWSNWKSGHL